MSQQYDNTNRFAVFENDRKENDKHADYKGSINIDGTEYWLDGWLGETKEGKRMLSGTVKLKDTQGKPAPRKGL